MSSLYKMSGTYRVHMTASHWGEAYDELKHRTESRPSGQRARTAPRRRSSHASKASSPTQH